VWQFDFSEYETTAGGIWQMGAAVDYWAKPALVCRVATTKTASDMIAALEEAIHNAGMLIDGSLAGDCVNPDTGEIEPLIIVTDNGSAMRSTAVAAWFQKRPWLKHIGTLFTPAVRHRRPTGCESECS